MTVVPPDRVTIAAAVMDELLSAEVDTTDDAVGVARIVARTDGVFAGAPVAGEIMAAPAFGPGRSSPKASR
jgi:hypothetical protein